MQRYIIPLLAVVFTYSALIGQNNLLRNGGFEADWSQGHYPRANISIDSISPYSWENFNNVSGTWARWYIDSIWTPFTPNDPNPNVQPGGYRQGYYSIAYPWDLGGQDSMRLQEAYEGECYIGFDTRTDGIEREGIEQYISNCPLNTGIYSVNLRYSHTYLSSAPKKFDLSLSRNADTRNYIFANFSAAIGTYTAGQWYSFRPDFEIKFKDKHKDLRWFSITGKGFSNSNPRDYMYFDDIRLYRQCDIDSACFNPTGQICPIFATPGPPGPPMVIKNIGNVDEIHVIIYNQMIQTLIDTTFFNPNGLPDFYFQPAILSGNVASGNYPYDVTLANKCGAVQYKGQFQVQAGIYDTLGPWIDSTANWSEVPKECCLHTLTLRDMEITGDVSYIVKDTIWITDGVSAAPGSDILIQAGQVVEMDSVEFDGTNTVVEILEAPCQGCRLLPPSSGGTAPDMAEIGTKGVITASRPPNRLETQALPISTSEAPNFRESKAEVENDFLTGLSAYPNPFTDKITLEVELSNPGSVSLIVYDLSMRPVKKVANGEILSEGMHLFRVDLNREASGIYFVQLIVNGLTFTEKVIKQ